MEVVDHYTSIMSFLAAGKGHPRVQSLPLEDRQRVLEEAARVEHERNEYVGRGGTQRKCSCQSNWGWIG